jgi:hypothetical protein
MSAASVKTYADQNWYGFFDSRDYLELVQSRDPNASDPGVYDSPYFGKLQGNIFGNQMDYTFEGYLIRTTGKNPGAAVTTAGGMNPDSLSGIHIALIAAAAFYFLG